MPLTFDKPLAELRQYPGINPRPTDFDAYWDGALQEMIAMDPQVELRPNPTLRPRGSECFDLYFTGVGAARVHAKYLRPNSPGPHPAVLQFHATPARAVTKLVRIWIWRSKASPLWPRSCFREWARLWSPFRYPTQEIFWIFPASSTSLAVTRSPASCVCRRTTTRL